MESLNAKSKAGVSSAAAFMQHVYTWMTGGLLVTAFVAYLFSTVPALLQMVSGFGAIVLALGAFGLAMYLSFRIDKLSATQATGFFLLYAAMNGAFLSPLLLIYTSTSVATAFVISAGMFGAMAVYGAVTKRDLTAMGSFLFMGLIGIILASLVNIFLQSSAMQFVINVIGVIVFAGLTAYDNQKIRQMGESAPWEDSTAIRRGAIMGALALYLDFLNMFLMILRLVGSSNE